MQEETPKDTELLLGECYPDEGPTEQMIIDWEEHNAHSWDPIWED